MRDASRSVLALQALGRRKLPGELPVRPISGEEPRFGKRLSDPQTDVAPGSTRGRNVRSKNQCSMCPAIHTKSRSWLRSSSTREPSDPLLRVVLFMGGSGFLPLLDVRDLYWERSPRGGRDWRKFKRFTEIDRGVPPVGGKIGSSEPHQGRHRVKRTYEAAGPQDRGLLFKPGIA